MFHLFLEAFHRATYQHLKFGETSMRKLLIYLPLPMYYFYSSSLLYSIQTMSVNAASDKIFWSEKGGPHRRRAISVITNCFFYESGRSKIANSFVFLNWPNGKANSPHKKSCYHTINFAATKANKHNEQFGFSKPTTTFFKSYQFP